jgi:NAD kinase
VTAPTSGPAPYREGAGAVTRKSAIPRVVVVSRPSEYDELLRRHGTRAQAAFFLGARASMLEEIEARHAAQNDALARVTAGLPTKWRRSRVPRAELSRFVFEPGDVIAAIGQDGLVANVAKYLDGQVVVGVDPLPGRNAGALVRFDVSSAADALRLAVEGRVRVESRTMVEAALDDGQSLLALNELYVGHRTHQSSRYRLSLGATEERQSSSGLIVATGTGATGWCLSIARGVGATDILPQPTERALAYFVREAWPSPSTGTTLVRGRLGSDAARALRVTSEMGDGGVVFGDGIEEDRLVIGWGVRVQVGIARRTLTLALP